jgi:tRNA pseudouridine32 synthase/23S rRNA pseudouridine746 synthase
MTVNRKVPAPASPLAARVLFIDGEAIVIDKPAGLPVDPPRDGSLSLENHLGSLTFGFQRLPLAVHRLDRDTSGCLLLARNPKAHQRFTQAFEQRQVGKRYLAVLAGVPAEPRGTIDLPIGKTSSAAEGWRMVPDPRGKPAVTHWEVVRVVDDRALVAFTPETGRTHQIRVHAREGIGIGIVGDPVYGTAGGPMLLHSAWLRVERDGKPPVEASAPLPPVFAAAGFAEPVP